MIGVGVKMKNSGLKMYERNNNLLELDYIFSDDEKYEEHLTWENKIMKAVQITEYYSDIEDSNLHYNILESPLYAAIPDSLVEMKPEKIRFNHHDNGHPITVSKNKILVYYPDKTRITREYPAYVHKDPDKAIKMSEDIWIEWKF